MVRVSAIEQVAARIRTFELVDPAGSLLEPVAPGSHVVMTLPSGLERQYSLCNDPSERHRYVIAVLREDIGRGGSREMHEAIRTGDELLISRPINNFPLAPNARSSLLIAGGIGITPILSMARALAQAGAEFELVYLTRTAEETAFLNVVGASPLASRTILHHDYGRPELSYDVQRLLACPAPERHAYCCGPTGLMAAVAEAAGHWPAGSVHFEYFSNAGAGAHVDDDRFTVRLARSGRSVEVAAGQTILDALVAVGMDVDFSCQEGTCGTCIVRALEGEVDHRDVVLSQAERDAGAIAICCSRARTGQLVLDL